jgi:hypothetical protein
LKKAALKNGSNQDVKGLGGDLDPEFHDWCHGQSLGLWYRSMAFEISPQDSRVTVEGDTFPINAMMKKDLRLSGRQLFPHCVVETY